MSDSEKPRIVGRTGGYVVPSREMVARPMRPVPPDFVGPPPDDEGTPAGYDSGEKEEPTDA